MLGPRAVRLVIDARETGRNIAGITSSSNPCRRARTIEPGNRSDGASLDVYGRPVRAGWRCTARETERRSEICRAGNLFAVDDAFGKPGAT
jgi:hypothetical protein